MHWPNDGRLNLASNKTSPFAIDKFSLHHSRAYVKTGLGYELHLILCSTSLDQLLTSGLSAGELSADDDS